MQKLRAMLSALVWRAAAGLLAAWAMGAAIANAAPVIFRDYYEETISNSLQFTAIPSGSFLVIQSASCFFATTGTHTIVGVRLSVENSSRYFALPVTANGTNNFTATGALHFFVYTGRRPTIEFISRNFNTSSDYDCTIIGKLIPSSSQEILD